MDTSYPSSLKAFVEGEKDLGELPAWWQENAHRIEENEGRTRYLKIRLEWQEGARQILDRHDVAYKLNEANNWDRCKKCGELLFHARPLQTTKEQINEFARNSNLLDKESIRREGWIHPGTSCSNGCTKILVSYTRNGKWKSSVLRDRCQSLQVKLPLQL